jgi:hypothetical protein
VTGVAAYSAGVLALIAAGLFFRKRPPAHIPLMLSAFALDLGSVVYLQLQRNAVQTAAGRPTAVLMVHVGFALTTLVLYGAMIVTGVRLLRRGAGRGAHKACAGAFLACRLGTYATSFFVS